MFLIQQPISRTASAVLGTLSVGLLLATYTGLSWHRQEAKRAAVRENLTTARATLAQWQVDHPGESTANLDPREAAQRDQLLHQVAALEKEATVAVDRSVPTWSSLYQDGVLRVIQPQGLRKNEYWLYSDAWATAIRLIAGLFVGVLLSVVLGVMMGAYSPIEAFLVPPLSFLAKIPPTAMLAVFFVMAGTGFPMYVALIAFGTLPTLAQTAYQAARKDVPPALIFKAYTLGASQAELIWNVIYKQILPRLLDAIRLQIGPAMVLLVAAEWMVAGVGFGYRLRMFYQRTDMSVVYVYLLILGGVGLAIDYGLIWFRRWLCPWFGK